ncbi:putative circadian clock protein, KaiC [Methanosalsum zhilinae DSM 4017]|uniref:Putative circadian clock protein, KaiC n=1 Tax=Methanosalsum zhilinae (strain DSM 4017 / NBRC 107636 / OCM 62 / WeN5) TaxID=679901 RepID=F7XNK8_METZD|nr:ATPase domain-containing protein [Methanosalsum zhilinae]AEH60105.1 putative circadian clock protein, KaiC [Methanosalsum zhilinae DSM 4017]
MARNKLPIHTTLSSDAIRILERYEKEMGAKNLVLEKALMGLDSSRFKGKFDAGNIDRVIKRISTGVEGLDEILEGGIPKGFLVIVTGPPGTGKTTFCMQALIEGARNREKCIFFSFEERVEQLVQHFLRFGCDVGEFIDEGYLEIFGMSKLTSEEIMEIIQFYNPERVAFDSMNVLTNGDEFRSSGSWRSLHRLLKSNKITTFFITEKKHGINTKKFDNFDFLGDGIIFLDSIPTNEIDSTPMPVIAIQKMRATRIDRTLQPFKFTDRGISRYRVIRTPSCGLSRSQNGKNKQRSSDNGIESVR